MQNKEKQISNFFSPLKKFKPDLTSEKIALITTICVSPVLPALVLLSMIR